MGRSDPAQGQYPHRRAGDGWLRQAVGLHDQPPRMQSGTGWRQPYGRARRWPTSSSCSSTRPGWTSGTDPRPLASEAVRGAGARLRGAERRVPAPSDADGRTSPHATSSAVPWRSAWRNWAPDHCYLDATLLGEAALEARFPTFVAACRAAGRDPARDWVPVAPTAHYTMGGVLADCDGRTTLEGLMAVGEVASSGLHGANRLASNSLLEGAVMGRRAARAIVACERAGAPRRSVRRCRTRS